MFCSVLNATSFSRHSSGPAALHLRREAAGRRAHPGRLQHSERVHAAPSPAAARRHPRWLLPPQHRAKSPQACAAAQRGEDDLPKVSKNDISWKSYFDASAFQTSVLAEVVCNLPVHY